MRLKQSDINHLRRLLGYVRCEIGQSPKELVTTVQSILPTMGEISSDGKQRLTEAYTQAQNVPKYVRAAIKALEKKLAEQGEIVDGEIDSEIPRLSRDERSTPTVSREQTP